MLRDLDLNDARDLLEEADFIINDLILLLGANFKIEHSDLWDNIKAWKDDVYEDKDDPAQYVEAQKASEQICEQVMWEKILIENPQHREEIVIQLKI